MIYFEHFRFWIFVQRQPSTNTAIGTWYESDKATENWPQYAAVEMMRDEGSTVSWEGAQNVKDMEMYTTDS